MQGYSRYEKASCWRLQHAYSFRSKNTCTAASCIEWNAYKLNSNHDQVNEMPGLVDAISQWNSLILWCSCRRLSSLFNECSGNVADVQWLAQPKKTRKRNWEFRCGLKGIDMDVPTNRGYDAPIDMRNSFFFCMGSGSFTFVYASAMKE